MEDRVIVIAQPGDPSHLVHAQLATLNPLFLESIKERRGRSGAFASHGAPQLLEEQFGGSASYTIYEDCRNEVKKLLLTDTDTPGERRIKTPKQKAKARARRKAQRRARKK